MRKKNARPYLFFPFLVILFLFPMIGLADEANTEEEMGFSVESVIPENQVDRTKTYFHLSVDPEQKQTIQVKLKSLQDTAVTIQIKVHDAVSSSIGAIDYAKDKPKLDRSLTHPITELVKIKGNNQEVTLRNKEEKTIEFEITPPKDPFSGVKLGSIRFLKKNEQAEKNKSGLIPQYARVIAVMLTEDEEPFNQGAELHLKRVGLQLSNGQKVIAARIQNDQPKVLQEMTIQGSVRRKDEKKTLAKHKMDNFSVAPNSNFDFEIPLGLEKFEAGTYVFTGKAEGDGRTWEWDKEFTVGKEQADKINDETVYKVQIPAWVPWTALALILGFIGLLFYLFHRQQQWKNEGK
ncbi:DUF916 and DUF3324 domain-containing protein [Enterococcus hulanensis]|uniref:DUF916 and DUF3324 domain-containing protein n=1 Tax=Enterococcus hulanensis TaxID=2559929 RepID=UPI0028BD7D34|nr:DUF916 and DUF3324 domain-containing protein [Enterococcus hulanensis]